MCVGKHEAMSRSVLATLAVCAVVHAVSAGHRANHTKFDPKGFPEYHVSRILSWEGVDNARDLGGLPAKDGKVVRRGIIADTPDRSLLYLTQTPQVFRRSIYADAMALAAEQGRDYTDDCQLVEAIGGKVYMTKGDYTNIKITTPEDIRLAETLLAMEKEKR